MKKAEAELTEKPRITYASTTQFEIDNKRWTLHAERDKTGRLILTADGAAVHIVRDDGGEFACTVTVSPDGAASASYCGRVRTSHDPRLAAAELLISLA